jgi:SAM-dependent methyltransferase
MKGRDSGMPDEAYWASFFRADEILGLLHDDADTAGGIVEFGCGYGTFTLPAARRTSGLVTALDIEPAMVAAVCTKAGAAGLGNVGAILRDFVAEGSGLADGSQTVAMIFNLLHIENPLALLAEAKRILREHGTLSVIHWRRDIPTPRGPALDIRPTPEQCADWMAVAGFQGIRRIDLGAAAPWHFGLTARR